MFLEPARPKPNDPFLANPDKLRYRISCVSCREPLWETRILKRSGTLVMSTETKRCDEVVPPFDRRVEKCAFCGDRFYGLGKTGGHLYLITDLNCGITRLV